MKKKKTRQWATGALLWTREDAQKEWDEASPEKKKAMVALLKNRISGIIGKK